MDGKKTQKITQRKTQKMFPQMTRKKGMECIGLLLLVLLILCMDMTLVLLEMAFLAGKTDTDGTGIAAVRHCLHYLIICMIWGSSSLAVYKQAGKRALLPEKTQKHFTSLRASILVLLSAGGILFMLANAGWHLKPVSEYQYFIQTYGAIGTAAFLGQHIYYLFESGLILLIVILGQRAGEFFFSSGSPSAVPWGWLACALSWGMLHGVSKDWNTAFFGIVLSAFFGFSYLAAERRILPAYTAIALIFIL